MTEQLKEQILRGINPCEGWCTPEKAFAMAELIVDNRPALVVELGVFGGKSLLPLAMACRSAGHGVTIGIDPWTPRAALEGTQDQAHIDWWSKTVDLKLIESLCIDAIDTNNLHDWCFIIKTASDSVAGVFADNSIGFFHLDANHSEEVSLRHVINWAPKIETGGHLVMDDIDWPSQRKAVSQLYQCGFIKLNNDPKYGIFKNAGQVTISKTRKEARKKEILEAGDPLIHGWKSSDAPIVGGTGQVPAVPVREPASVV